MDSLGLPPIHNSLSLVTPSRSEADDIWDLGLSGEVGHGSYPQLQLVVHR